MWGCVCCASAKLPLYEEGVYWQHWLIARNHTTSTYMTLLLSCSIFYYKRCFMLQNSISLVSLSWIKGLSGTIDCSYTGNVYLNGDFTHTGQFMWQWECLISVLAPGGVLSSLRKITLAMWQGVILGWGWEICDRQPLEVWSLKDVGFTS